MRRWPVTTALVLVVTALLVTGCGGGDDDSSSGSSSSSSTSSTTLAADAASTKLAQDALLTAADVGAGWVEYAPAEQPKPYTEECADLRSHAVDVPGGTKTKGAILQYGDQAGFIQSDVLVFKDEAAAAAFVEDRLSQEYLECFRKVLEKEQKSRDENLEVSISTEEDPNIGTGGYEGSTRYSVTGAEGTEVAAAYRTVWQFGRVVILVGLDVGQSNDPSLAGIVSQAASTGLGRAEARLQQ